MLEPDEKGTLQDGTLEGEITTMTQDDFTPDEKEEVEEPLDPEGDDKDKEKQTETIDKGEADKEKSGEETQIDVSILNKLFGSDFKDVEEAKTKYSSLNETTARLSELEKEKQALEEKIQSLNPKSLFANDTEYKRNLIIKQGKYTPQAVDELLSVEDIDKMDAAEAIHLLDRMDMPYKEWKGKNFDDEIEAIKRYNKVVEEDYDLDDKKDKTDLDINRRNFQKLGKQAKEQLRVIVQSAKEEPAVEQVSKDYEANLTGWKELFPEALKNAKIEFDVPIKVGKETLTIKVPYELDADFKSKLLSEEVAKSLSGTKPTKENAQQVIQRFLTTYKGLHTENIVKVAVESAVAKYEDERYKKEHNIPPKDAKNPAGVNSKNAINDYFKKLT